MPARIALDGTGPVRAQAGPFVQWSLRNDGVAAATFLLDGTDHTLDAGQTLSASDRSDRIETFEFEGTTDFRFFAVYDFA